MKIMATNKKAFHDYEILEKIEAGLVLTGDEVKSIRAGHMTINEAFALIRDNQAVLMNAYIAPYSHAFSKQDTSRRNRVLLLQRRQILKLVGTIARKGLTLIPLRAYFTERGYVKVELGLAKHKSAQSKKQELRERDIKREAQREVKTRIS
jgi:SsrA-binding protein